MSFTGRIRNITLSTLDELDRANAEIAELKRNKTQYYKPHFEELMTAATEKRNRVITKGRSAVYGEIDDFKKNVKQSYTLDGEQLHPDAALLNSGLALSFDDLERLMDKHKGNHTMERLLHEYAKKNDIHVGRVYVGENDLIEAADTMRQYFENVMHRPEYGDIWRNQEWFDTNCPQILSGE